MESLYHTSEGTGDSEIILVHGFGTSTVTWNRIMKLAQAGYKITRLDLPGHGNSYRKPDKMRLNDLSNALSLFLTSRVNENTILVGHSLGSILLQKLLDRSSEKKLNPKAVCFIDGSAYTKKVPSSIRSLARTPGIVALNRAGLIPWKFLTKIGWKQVYHRKDNIPTDLIEQFIKALIIKDTLECYKNLAKSICKEIKSDIERPDLSGVTCPSQIVWGENDRLFSYEEAFHLDSILPDSQVEIIKDCGHIPHEEQPQIFYDILLRFLKRLQ